MQNIKVQIKLKSSLELWADSKTEYVKFMFYTNNAGDICQYKIARSLRVWDTADN